MHSSKLLQPPRSSIGKVSPKTPVCSPDGAGLAWGEGVCEKTVRAIESNSYSLIVVNFANADMVGHTGIMKAAVNAAEAIDKALGEIYKSILETNGTFIITADHGNAEQMLNEDGSIRTAHSLKPVPFILINKSLKSTKLKPEGTLADIAPTILDIMDIEKPEEMTGNSLITSSLIASR